jgi:hypothetical protein
LTGIKPGRRHSPAAVTIKRGIRPEYPQEIPEIFFRKVTSLV